MSVTNRKMFRRDARNKLRNMGGIMASSEPLIQEVAKYQLGGGVNIMTQPTNQIPVIIGGSPRKKSFQEKLLDAYNRMIEPKGLPGMVKTNNVATMAGSGVGNTTSAIDSRYADEFVQGDAAQLGKQIQTSAGLGVPSGMFEPKFETSVAPTIVSGQGLEGMEDVFKNQALQAQKDAEAQKLLEAETIAMREAEKKTAVEGGMPDPAQTGKTDEKVLEDALSGGRSSIDRQTLGVTADEGEKAKAEDLNKKFKEGKANLSDINEQVKNTVNTGVGVNGSMEQLMKEFTSNIKEYEGLDRGLAIAKIGFAMAAGESPNAITNIAKALEQGADMFIKDKAERDAFNRQVNLAAVQYGLGEISKQRAEGRAIARERRKYEMMTFGPNGGTYRGRKYGAYEDVPVLVGDIQDNKMPSGLVSTSTIKALGTKGKSFEALQKELIKQKVISEDGARKDQQAYADFVDTAITAERGQVLVNKILLGINDPEKGITGISPALKKIQRKILDTVGQRTEIDSITEAQTYMRQLLQDIVPVTIGGYQGANSISNRDIDLLITAFFGDNALEEGNFQFVTQNVDSITKRLQGAAARMKQSQTSAFSGMRALETRLATQYQRGSLDIVDGQLQGVSALNLLAEDRKRLEDKGLSFEGSPTGSSVGFFRDDKGVIQMKNPALSKG